MTRALNLRTGLSPPGILRFGTLCLGVLWSGIILGGSGCGRSGGTAEEPFSRAPVATRSLLLDVSSRDGIAVAVGERGLILLSTDDGGSWHCAASPMTTTLCGVAATEGNGIWAVGYCGGILHSTDDGRTWTSARGVDPSHELPLFGVWFEDTSRGFAYGAYGLFLETDDGGSTWNSREVMETDLHLYAMTETSGGDLYLVGESGLVLRSADRGETWEVLESPYQGSFFGALALPQDGLLAFGLRGHLYRIDDHGHFWRRIETGTTASLLGGLRRGDDSIVIVGQGGTALVSRDGGESFTPSGSSQSGDLVAVGETPGGRLLLVGDRGVRRFDEVRERESH